MELLVGPLQESKLPKETEFRFGRKGDMDAGGSIDIAQLDQTPRKHAADLVSVRTRPHQ